MNKGRVDAVSSLDDAIKDYFCQADVIAELINHFILKEENVNPSEMLPVDLMPIFRKLREYGSGRTIEEFQNEYKNIFLMKTERLYCALLVETEISYDLPIKAFSFESGLYETETETWDALSEGGLLPCLTFVLYLNPDNWGGYYHLHEMYKNSNEALIKLAPDYTLNMIEPAKLTEDTIAELSDDLGGVLSFAKICDDATKMQGFLLSEAYAHMGNLAKELLRCISYSIR
ncbi:MAG: hypothetical protein LUE20_03535 [Oscillospiraceae bacterium]|nr:hypothetical protein [Oscillospiraceae bacterium]